MKECRLIEIPRFVDHRGTLSVIDGTLSLPFEPKRFYYLYNLVAGTRRGCHAHRTEQELIMALAGSFRVFVDDGQSTAEFQLERPNDGLYVPPLVWHELHSFAPGAVCAVLASTPYDVNDYYDKYEDFVLAVHHGEM